VRVLECPHGANGWHPHYHGVLLLEHAPAESELQALREFLSSLWRKTVDRVMGRAYRPTLEHGVDLSPCRRATYLTKLGLAAELTDVGQAKRSEKGRSYWQMTSDWEADGASPRHADAPLIREFIEDMKGAQFVAFGKGLRERARKLLEAKKPKPAERERASVYTEEFKALRHLRTEDGRDALVAVLDVAELAEPGRVDAAVRAFVDDLLRRKRRTMTVDDRHGRGPPVHRPYPAGAG
jgi:hypothetical protein